MVLNAVARLMQRHGGTGGGSTKRARSSLRVSLNVFVGRLVEEMRDGFPNLYDPGIANQKGLDDSMIPHGKKTRFKTGV